MTFNNDIYILFKEGSMKDKLLIKFTKSSTIFIRIKDFKKIVYWGDIPIGENAIVSDISKSLSNNSDIKEITKARGVCLSNAIGIKDNQEIEKIIQKRISEIFSLIRQELIKEDLLDYLGSCFLIKEDNFLPNMESMLKGVMIHCKVETIDLSDLNIKLNSKRFSFKEFFHEALSEF